MAKGVPPKPPEKRARRNAEVPMVELGDAPARPPNLPNASKFSARTRAWYAVWKNSRQAGQFVDTDWQRLHMLAYVVEQYFASPNPSTLAEIRREEAAFGATPEDRLRLRWRFAANRTAEERAEPKPDAPPENPSNRGRDPRLALVRGGR